MFMVFAVIFALVAAVCAIVLLVAAFKESTAQGLLCLFVPLYIFYFAFARYASPRKPVLVGLWLGSLTAAVTCQIIFVRQATAALNQAVGELQAEFDKGAKAALDKELTKHSLGDGEIGSPSRVRIDAPELFEQYSKAEGIELLDKWGSTDLDLDGRVNRTAVVGKKTMVWLETGEARKYVQVDVTGKSRLSKGQLASFSCGRVAGMTDDYIQVQNCKVVASR